PETTTNSLFRLTAPFAVSQTPSYETVPFCILYQAPIHCVFISHMDCIPTPFRQRSLSHSSNKPHFIVFSPAVLTTFQHFSETVHFC
ncbi:Uncharacterized protein APZ42_009401, partial [Daphnia magna]